MASLDEQMEFTTRNVLLGALGILLLTALCYYVVILGIWYQKWRKVWQTAEKIPGPEKHWLFGTLHTFPGYNDTGLAWLVDVMCKWPYYTRLWVGPVSPIITIYHPETVKALLRTSEPKQQVYKLVEPWLGDGLLLSKGNKWLRNRKLLTPAFHFDVLKPYIDIYNQATDILMEKWSANKSVEICQPITLFTLNTILRCAFSYNEDVQRMGISHPYANAVLDMSEAVLTRALNPLLYLSQVFYCTPVGWRFAAGLKVIHKTCDTIVKKRKQILLNEDQAARKRFPDFLDILLLARDEEGKGLSEQEIKDEVNTFLFEGHDTTASAISWILYTLACHPKEQQKCRDEVASLFEGRETDVMEWDDLSNMPYTLMCIKEAMRLHTPVPVIGRQITQPLEINGVTLPEKSNIDINVYLLHHNPLIWGEDHMEFKPERFEPERYKHMDPFAYAPFSAGQRNCIGQNFAMHEIKICIARTLHRFVMTVDPDHKVEHMQEIVMRAKNGIKLFFTPV